MFWVVSQEAYGILAPQSETEEACGILAPQSETEPTPPALAGEVWTTGLTGKSLLLSILDMEPVDMVGQLYTSK